MVAACSKVRLKLFCFLSCLTTSVTVLLLSFPSVVTSRAGWATIALSRPQDFCTFKHRKVLNWSTSTKPLQIVCLFFLEHSLCKLYITFQLFALASLCQESSAVKDRKSLYLLHFSELQPQIYLSSQEMHLLYQHGLFRLTIFSSQFHFLSECTTWYPLVPSPTTQQSGMERVCLLTNSQQNNNKLWGV